MPKGITLISPIGKEIYNQIIKPKLMQNNSCYRTYDIRLMSGIMQVEYKMDIVKSGMSRLSTQEVEGRMKNALEAKLGESSAGTTRRKAGKVEKAPGEAPGEKK